MTHTPTSRDLTPPPPPADDHAVPEALRLGIDIEELYFFFGEGERAYLIALGVGGGLPEGYANKVDRVRTGLWSLPDGAGLVHRLDDLLGPAPTTTAAGAEGDQSLERLFDDLMHTLRLALPDDAVPWYDLGVGLAKLHLCLEFTQSPPPEPLRELHGIYLVELRRIVPVFAHTLLRLVRHASTASAPTSLVRSISVLVDDIIAFDDGAPDWNRTTREHVDAVFTAIGMTYTESNPLLLAVRRDAPTTDGPAPDPVADLDRRHAACREALLGHHPEAAEECLRGLLVTARRTVGPHDPRVFLIKSDLSLALLVLGRDPLCAELALDAVTEAVAHLGKHHRVTLAVAHGALWVLRATGRGEAAEALSRTMTSASS
ncbi:hypothetical protein B0I31_12610 [Saccharothrix carnea]|uniref:Tetratricopeptide repeat protein n=1 Tax=Saccharothrix carnea TaxID=1280637 RepID=A0A2P8HID6_SACCR|nr:hypothetical protein [Saccharothrix carnea]PSL45979.1 hypothetical protein B0I31_12610 [Saccharothrix carnea]